MEGSDCTIDNVYAQIKALRQDIACVEDPYTSGPQAVSVHLSQVANCLTSLGSLRQDVIRTRARSEREIRILTQILEREVANTIASVPEIAKIRTKDERRVLAEDKHADRFAELDRLKSEFNSWQVLSDYIESLRSDIRQIIRVYKMQMESMWRDNIDSSLPIAAPKTWRNGT